MNTEKENSKPLESYTFEVLDQQFRNRPGDIDPPSLKETSPEIIARFMEEMEIDSCRVILRKLTGEKAADALSEMDPELSSKVLLSMREFRSNEIMNEIAPDDAADIVAELEEADRNRFIQRLEPDNRESVRKLLAYDPETAGGIMTTEIVTIPPDLTVDESIQAVREISNEVETVYYLYVTGPSNVLLGVVSMRDIMLARSGQKIEDIMGTTLHGVCFPDDDQEQVAIDMAKHNFLALPVVERGTNRLLGIITHDDIMDVVQEEATEDLQKLVGAGPDECIRDSVGEGVRRRWPWLIVNLLTAFGAAAIIKNFEETIEQIILLAAFMPIVASLAGNAGHQTLAIAIRSIATGDIHKGDALPLCSKELAKGLINGILVGLVGGVGAYFLSSPEHNIKMGLTIFLALILTMGLAGFTGAFIPLFLKRINLDPAQSSSIFLTAVTDMAGFFIFLQLASMLLL